MSPNSHVLRYSGLSIGAWLSLVEHLVRDQGVGGSNPLAPILTTEIQDHPNRKLTDCIANDGCWALAGKMHKFDTTEE